VHIDASQSPALFALASERLGGHYRHDWNHKVLTLIGERGIVSQAVFTGISPGVKAELTMWSDPARGLGGRHFIRTIFAVVFGYADGQWGCDRLHAVTRKSNVVAQKALLDLGFVFESSHEAWFRSEEGLMFRMLRRECRWLRATF